MPAALPLAVIIIYAVCLFAFASWAESHSNARLKQRLRVPAYALALAGYCTSWTYYKSPSVPILKKSAACQYGRWKILPTESTALLLSALFYVL